MTSLTNSLSLLYLVILYYLLYDLETELGTGQPLRHGQGTMAIPGGLQGGRLHPGPVHQLLHTGQVGQVPAARPWRGSWFLGLSPGGSTGGTWGDGPSVQVKFFC